MDREFMAMVEGPRECKFCGSALWFTTQAGKGWARDIYVCGSSRKSGVWERTGDCERLARRGDRKKERIAA